jgi:hypothetical protein
VNVHLPRLRDPRVGIGILVLLVLGVMYGRLLRIARFPEALRFVSPETVLLIATGDIASLWNSIDAHIPRLRAGEASTVSCDGLVGPGIQSLARHLREAGSSIDDLADLRDLGIDVERGMLLALGPGTQAGLEPVLVIPLLDDTRFSERLARVQGHPLGVRTCRLDSGRPTEMLETNLPETLGLWHGVGVLHLDERHAVLGPSCHSLARALGDPNGNLAHAREDDWLYTFVARYHSRRLMTGPTLVAYWKGLLATEFGPIALAVSVDPRRIDVDLVARPRGGRSRLISELLARPPVEIVWRHQLLDGSLGEMVIRDEAISGYLDLLASAPEAAERMKHDFGGLLWHLRTVPSLDQVSIGLIDYEEGFPRTAIGLWGDTEELTKLVTRVQIGARIKRDKEILSGALRVQGPPVKDLTGPQVEVGLELDANGRDDFSGYSVRVNGEIVAPTFVARDFENPDWIRSFQGRRIRYLVPPVTDNDIEYRFDASELRDVDEDFLRTDRFRASAVLLDGALWLAADARDLELIIQRSQREDRSVVSGSDSDRRKLDLTLRIHRVIDEAIASPELNDDPGDNLIDSIYCGLWDLRRHDWVSFALDAGPPGAVLHVSATAVRSYEPIVDE